MRQTRIAALADKSYLPNCIQIGLPGCLLHGNKRDEEARALGLRLTD
jgi:hypothetical protein